MALVSRNCCSTPLVPLLGLLPNLKGIFFKSVKSKLQNALDEKMNLVDSVPQNCARVFDGMSIVQQIPSGLEIFGCLSDFILTRITNNPSLNIFFTTDQYWDASIKSCERNRRTNSGSIRITASRRDQVTEKVQEVSFRWRQQAGAD